MHGDRADEIAPLDDRGLARERYVCDLSQRHRWTAVGGIDERRAYVCRAATLAYDTAQDDRDGGVTVANNRDRSAAVADIQPASDVFSRHARPTRAVLVDPYVDAANARIPIVLDVDGAGQLAQRCFDFGRGPNNTSSSGPLTR